MPHTPAAAPATVSRRSVATGIAWSVPAIASVAAAPAFAASPNDQLKYRFRGSGYSRQTRQGFLEDNTTFGVQGSKLRTLQFDNQTDVGTSPHGFAIVEMPLENDPSTLSPRTEATIDAPVQLVVAYARGMVDMTRSDYYTITGNYSLTGHRVATLATREITTTGGTVIPSVTTAYDVFTFTWHGPATQSTVADQTADGTRPQSWANTLVTVDWKVNENYVTFDGMPFFTNYYGGSGTSNLNNLGTFTTANGFEGPVRANQPLGGWAGMI
ncbi:MAG: hypothetical protein Q4G34_08110 [Micrococcus sp.]|nr:hypothetical protein [Micrococcus sp.]